MWGKLPPFKGLGSAGEVALEGFRFRNRPDLFKEPFHIPPESLQLGDERASRRRRLVLLQLLLRNSIDREAQLTDRHYQLFRWLHDAIKCLSSPLKSTMQVNSSGLRW